MRKIIRCKFKKHRKRKEVIRNIKCIYKRCEKYEKNNGQLSEIDTQILLIEPILCLAGYDIYNPYVVKRASRSKQSQEFDIEVYKNGKLFLAIEVKRISSSEFNIDKINKGIGKLSRSNNRWINNNGDGTGQLRAYCLNWNNKLNPCTIPILTNGKEWVLFNLSSFTQNPQQTINNNMILDKANITDSNFYNKIIQKIKNT